VSIVSMIKHLDVNVLSSKNDQKTDIIPPNKTL
jgi:hypothetical protein